MTETLTYRLLSRQKDRRRAVERSDVIDLSVDDVVALLDPPTGGSRARERSLD